MQKNCKDFNDCYKIEGGSLFCSTSPTNRSIVQIYLLLTSTYKSDSRIARVLTTLFGADNQPICRAPAGPPDWKPTHLPKIGNGIHRRGDTNQYKNSTHNPHSTLQVAFPDSTNHPSLPCPRPCWDKRYPNLWYRPYFPLSHITTYQPGHYRSL